MFCIEFGNVYSRFFRRLGGDATVKIEIKFFDPSNPYNACIWPVPDVENWSELVEQMREIQRDLGRTAMILKRKDA